MSIVEKALSKLQDARPAERRQAVDATQAQPARMPIEDIAPSKLSAHHKLTIDPAALQRAGVLPQQVDANAMRNQFRRLKWPVFDEVAARRREAQSCAGAVMIASARAGEGKTFTCCNLALSMAREEDKTIVLIDCDIAKAQLTDVFGLRDKPGITEYLSQPGVTVADVLYATSIDRLFFIPAGKFVAHVSELLSSGRMQQLLRDLTGNSPGTVVLLDTSPVLATNEAQVLARLIPQIVLIVQAEKTPQPMVIEACDILGREKVSAVLNQARVWFDAESYQAGYGYYENSQRE